MCITYILYMILTTVMSPSSTKYVGLSSKLSSNSPNRVKVSFNNTYLHVNYHKAIDSSTDTTACTTLTSIAYIYVRLFVGIIATSICGDAYFTALLSFFCGCVLAML
jgi:hypothetical protein